MLSIPGTRGVVIFTDPNYELLTQPIDPNRVKSREGGGGKSLSYIAGHDAIATANDVFGIGGWGYTVDELVCLGEEEVKSQSTDKYGYRVGYRAIVRVTLFGHLSTSQGAYKPVSYADVGFGDSIEYRGSRITPHELAMKEAVTDGLKRALKNLGEQFGLSLYSEEGRGEIAARAKLLASETALKNEVWRIAKVRLEKDKPTAVEVAQLFGLKKAGDLTDRATLVKILEGEGAL